MDCKNSVEIYGTYLKVAFRNSYILIRIIKKELCFKCYH